MKRLVFLALICLGCGSSSIENTNNTMKEKVYSQEEMMQVFIPELKSSGVLYKKTKEVLARKAATGEIIETITSDGLETVNTADEGDYIIKNQTEAEEMYIIGGAKFHDRYDFKEKADDDFSLYKAKGKVIALEMTMSFIQKKELPDSFLFIAPWNENMIVKKMTFSFAHLNILKYIGLLVKNSSKLTK